MHCSDAVAVTIRSETGIIAAANGFTERGDVRFDRLGIRAAEERITRAANLMAGYAVPPHQRNQQTARRAVHRIDDEAKLGGSQLFPVDQFVDGIEIGRKDIERMDLIRTRRQIWEA